MNIGLVIDGDLEETSGGYRYDRKLVAALERRGDEVDVTSLSQLPTETAASLDGETETPSDAVVHDRLDRPYDVLLQDELCYPTLVEHNRHLTEPTAVLSIVHLLQAGDPAVDDPVVRRRERRYLETVDGIVCPSADTRERVLALINDEIPTLVAPPGGRHEDAALSAPTVDARARSTPFRLVYVGTVVPRKQLTTLLEALCRADGAIDDWRLTVVGDLDADPAYVRRARALADERGLDDRVAFRGRLETAALESLLERSHVLAVPSRYESFGMVYLEAMEYGVVPIAGHVGGASEFVADGRNGAVVDSTDPAALAARLETLAADRDRLASLGTAALRTAAAHPAWEETLERVRTFCRRRCRLEGASNSFDDGRGEPG
ncbi:glycosyltransferase family 4 protein [Natronolimnohabitans sp. A-GB9]|uniref:glycosyltransferase family 4 protein n=1 Tax=Natronolimnohabitans sp. A-GB9 TaxID=3069757 RepID=UPI0027B3D67E|nr:glycosyltransferase family 4 protein [Natronolimnohabitans sp. A-GB9]MDQ2049116.1 glycosyltransferase family 4 protein [Natronolimnohabitans sp. A-GB9]